MIHSQDSQVTIQRMLSSPFLADHKEEAKQWADDLHSAEEIIQHWTTAQTNVSTTYQVQIRVNTSPFSLFSLETNIYW